MSKISIVIPVYYNADTLMLLYEDMKQKILGKLGDYELVFVDDGSGDNSWEVMNDIRKWIRMCSVSSFPVISENMRHFWRDFPSARAIAP